MEGTETMNIYWTFYTILIHIVSKVANTWKSSANLKVCKLSLGKLSQLAEMNQEIFLTKMLLLNKLNYWMDISKFQKEMNYR